MSGLDGLQLDADGYLDMDQFPDDGTDLADADLAQLREALHADPVDEPTAEQWDAMFDDALAGADTGPFALDDAEGLVGEDAFDLDPGPTDPDALVDAPVDDDLADDVPADDDLTTTTDDLDLDLDLDDGGLDLAPDDVIDDAFSAEALDDGPAEVAGSDFEDLL